MFCNPSSAPLFYTPTSVFTPSSSLSLFGGFFNTNSEVSNLHWFFFHLFQGISFTFLPWSHVWMVTGILYVLVVTFGYRIACWIWRINAFLHANFPVFHPLDSIHLYSLLMGRTVSFTVIKLFVFTGVNKIVNDGSKIIIVAPQQALLTFSVIVNIYR